MAKQFVDLAGAQFLVSKILERAPLASPELTGTPTVPTAAAGTSTTQAASTEFVMNAVAEYSITGTVENYEDLPQNPNTGDVYRVENETTLNPGSDDEVTYPGGTDFEWDGEKWVVKEAVEVEAIPISVLEAMFAPTAPSTDPEENPQP